MSIDPKPYRIGWTTHPKFRDNLRHRKPPHRPWQAEVEGLQFARRGLTPTAARRKTMRDVAYATGEVTGHPIDSPYQLARAAWAHHPLKRWIAAKQDATYAVAAARSATKEPLEQGDA